MKRAIFSANDVRRRTAPATGNWGYFWGYSKEIGVRHGPQITELLESVKSKIGLRKLPHSNDRVVAVTYDNHPSHGVGDGPNLWYRLETAEKMEQGQIRPELHLTCYMQLQVWLRNKEQIPKLNYAHRA